MRSKETRAPARPSTLVQGDVKALGLQIREARRRLKLGQGDVAFAANVSPRTVFAIEKGKPTVRIDMLVRVLAAVGLRLATENRDRVWSPQPPEAE